MPDAGPQISRKGPWDVPEQLSEDEKAAYRALVRVVL
jgi:hypothetical protein